LRGKNIVLAFFLVVAINQILPQSHKGLIEPISGAKISKNQFGNYF
jgi:hypothetical protein